MLTETPWLKCIKSQASGDLEQHKYIRHGSATPSAMNLTCSVSTHHCAVRIPNTRNIGKLSLWLVKRSCPVRGPCLGSTAFCCEILVQPPELKCIYSPMDPMAMVSSINCYQRTWWSLPVLSWRLIRLQSTVKKITSAHYHKSQLNE